MKIGIDIDETLTDTKKSFYEVLKKHQIKFDEEYNDWYKRETAQFIVNNYLEEIIENAKLKSHAKEILDKLYNLGYELIIITARSNRYSKNIIKITNNLIEENKLKISKIYFCQCNKSDIAKEIGIDLMIDDNIEVFHNMQKEKIDCILFGDKIKTWIEVFDYIMEKRKEKSWKMKD